MDFAIMSIILIVSHLLRYLIKPLQKYYIPTSIIAGFAALFCGYQFLDILPFAMNDAGSPFMAGYPGILIVVLYSTLFLGYRAKKEKDLKKVIKNVGDTFFNCFSIQVAQYGVAVIFGLTIIALLFPSLHKGFASLMPAGFIGGHGVATAIGSTYASNGWEEGLTVGYTFATSGLLIGLFGGIIMINIATRRGWTRLIKEPKQLPDYMLTGFIPKDSRQSVGTETIHSISLETLTWHLALLLAAYAIGSWIITLITKVWSNIAIPHFATAMIAGFGIQKLLDMLNLGQYVDRKLMNTIGSCATDYLIAFAVATMNIKVVVKYATPLTVLVALGAAYCVWWTLWLGPRIYHNYWFERSIFVYGFATGVMATGVTLLRVVDPNQESGTLEDYGIAYVALSFLSIIIPIVVPLMILGDQAWALGIGATLIGIAGIVSSRFLVGWWSKTPKATSREGEKEFNIHGC